MCQPHKQARVACQIISNEPIAKRVYEMKVQCPEIVSQTTPGQFVNLYCHHKGRLLPRPISVCEIDHKRGQLYLVYGILGAGTDEFSGYKAGEYIDVMGPFGNGFTLATPADQYLIVGGGVGTPPMVELCKQLEGNKTIVVGFRDTPYLVDRLQQYGDVHVTTDDGSVGFKGHVVECMEQQQLRGTIYACGPTPMLKGVQAFAAAYNLEASLSLEERMGCGFGACVGCVVKIIADTDAGYTYKKVCKDGPVFGAKEVIFP